MVVDRVSKLGTDPEYRTRLSHSMANKPMAKNNFGPGDTILTICQGRGSKFGTLPKYQTRFFQTMLSHPPLLPKRQSIVHYRAKHIA